MRYLVIIFSCLWALLLSSCGFQPANHTVFDGKKDSASRSIIPPVYLPEAKSKTEFLLKSELEKKLVQSGGKYRISWQYNMGFVGQNLSVNDNYQRFNKRYTLKWSLYNNQGKRLKSFTSQTNIAIDILRTGYPFEAATQDADRQAAKTLAQDVYNQLQMYFTKAK